MTMGMLTLSPMKVIAMAMANRGEEEKIEVALDAPMYLMAIKLHCLPITKLVRPIKPNHRSAIGEREIISSKLTNKAAVLTSTTLDTKEISVPVEVLMLCRPKPAKMADAPQQKPALIASKIPNTCGLQSNYLAGLEDIIRIITYL